MDNNYNDNSNKYEGVGGWLLLFCIVLTIISPVRSLYQLITAYKETNQLFEMFPGMKNVFYVDSTLSVVLMFMSVRAGLALWNVQSNAVKIAKNYLLMALGYAVVTIFLPFTAGLPTEANEAMVPEVIKSTLQSLVFVGIWYSYLNVSIRVKATYGSNPLSTAVVTEENN